MDKHLIPTLDVLLEKLQGGQFYSKIDLADAYLQLKLVRTKLSLIVVNEKDSNILDLDWSDSSVSTNDHGNTEDLSRLLTEVDADFDRFETRENSEILYNIEEVIHGIPLTHDHVRSKILRDSTLKSISLYIRRKSWPKPVCLNSDLIPFFNQKTLCVLKTMLICCNVKESLELLFLALWVETFYA